MTEVPFLDLSRRNGSLSVSERLCEEIVSLPLYPELTDAEADQVIEAIQVTARGRPTKPAA